MSKQKETSGGGSSYFQNSKNTELSELQSDLNTMKVDVQRDAMKQIIASMTIGKDVSPLFPHVVKCMRTSNVELKKLIYLYIINYAKAKPDTTLLAVNAFHTDATDKNSPLLRALAVRTMGCIRVNMIVTYLCETLKLSLKDEDPYVRKTACVCVAKLYSTCPGLVRENGFIETLTNLLVDGNAVVVANAMVALNEISILSGQNQLHIKNKMIKRILSALNEANEWGQVFILDALVNYVPKKDSYAEDIIESVIPRLSHENPAVVMSAVKVILKFLDKIENNETAKNYCKKVSNCLMTVMMSSPEIQYVLLRSLHAIVQKRPYLLDKDYKYFYVKYNDPVYIKLEKIDILYKLTDHKNYESILNELKSYAQMEFDVELVKKAIKYMGYIAYKIEKSLDTCVECMKEILDHNQDFTISEGLIVSRDLMRKYKGKSLELLKKITPDLVRMAMEPESKCAVLYIIGEFCFKISNSTTMIQSFVETFNEESDSVKLQILNAVIKNFVNKPDETEDIVKEALQKGGQETENPDVRDRAYIYWRLLENDPDLAKDMIMGEKPAFDYNEDSTLNMELVDDIIENMTNMSAVYHQGSKELILKDDMVIDPEAENLSQEIKDSEVEKQEEKGEKKGKSKKQPKMVENKINTMDQDLLGLDEDANNNQNVAEINTGIINSMDIFNDIFGGNNEQSNTNSTSNTGKTGNTGGMPFDPFDFVSGGQPASSTTTNAPSSDGFGFEFPDSSSTTSNYDDSIPGLNFFPNSQVSHIKPTVLHTANTPTSSGSTGLSVYASFSRSNTSPIIALALKNSTSSALSNIKFNLHPNSFGIYYDSGEPNLSVGANTHTVAVLNLGQNREKSNGQAPSEKYQIQVTLSTSIGDVNVNVPFSLNTLFTPNGKITSQDEFKKFFGANKEGKISASVQPLRSDVKNEQSLNKVLESNNVYTVCKNSKADPVVFYYSCSVSAEVTVVFEMSFDKNNPSMLNVNVLTGNTIIKQLAKEAIELVLKE
mmetsp:Transcript_21766/g.22669  ORF Transcript_21766/g.22669 Transcript_21766/m.22669 type:complete len:1000 (+) Transcript_21766:12-3011(+)